MSRSEAASDRLQGDSQSCPRQPIRAAETPRHMRDLRFGEKEDGELRGEI